MGNTLNCIQKNEELGNDNSDQENIENRNDTVEVDYVEMDAQAIDKATSEKQADNKDETVVVYAEVEVGEDDEVPEGGKGRPITKDSTNSGIIISYPRNRKGGEQKKVSFNKQV